MSTKRIKELGDKMSGLKAVTESRGEVDLLDGSRDEAKSAPPSADL
jgi:hypothetical protein